jgi:ATP-dependent Lon protease
MTQGTGEGGGEEGRDAPLLPLRDIIVFPSMVVPLFVGRERSIAALKEAMERDKRVVLCAQRQPKTNDPGPDDLFSVGTLGTIRQMIQLPDGTVKVLVMGERRVEVVEFLSNPKHFEVRVTGLAEVPGEPERLDALVTEIRQTFESYVKLNRRIPPEMLTQVAKIEDPARLADTIVAQLALKLPDKQQILELEEVAARLERLLALMRDDIEILQVEKKIRSRVKKQMEKTQKDFYVGDAPPEQKEDGNEFKNEIEEIEARIKEKDLPEAAGERLEREVKKLKLMSPMSAEATVVRNYIDWVLGLPWTERTDDQIDVEAAQAQLDADHHGLDRPKDRILEYLAVRALTKTPRGPILCMVGPPGVGKTSLGRSIATSLGREFVRLSLGGVRDEAEIRGHRRTYIGALPGKIVQSMRKAGSCNPVFLLDEVDKMSTDFRGDPSSALLEVLDPEQNATFNDHYLDLDYDLSGVMFVCTANNLSGIPGPLRDRMEIIEIAGYTDEEKLEIARAHLVDKQIEANGLGDVEVEFTSSALRRIIEGYTREAGVRGLEREISGVCRKIARRVVAGEGAERYKVRAKTVPKYLGPPKHEREGREERDAVGMTHGLAWTQFGGVMLASEVSVMPGAGKFIITGKLGDVMQESAQAAMSYVRARALNLGLAPEFHKHVDMHVHFPEGALPKDGPSAGITMATGIVSALTGLPVRHDVAMTGEITLRGRVLPIGGLKEKLLAAHRSRIKTVLIPHSNLKDLRDVPPRIRKGLEVVGVRHMDEVLVRALRLEDPEGFAERLARPLSLPHTLSGQEGGVAPGSVGADLGAGSEVVHAPATGE